LVKHFKGKLSCFEIGNEPNAKPKGLGEEYIEGFSLNSDPELYGKVVARVAEIIKNENPKAKIISGGVVFFDPEFIRKTLEEVKKYEEDLRREKKLESSQYLLDYTGFHPYRENPESPCPLMKNGVAQYGKTSISRSYEDQL